MMVSKPIFEREDIFTGEDDDEMDMGPYKRLKI